MDRQTCASVVLLEDEALIALDVEYSLRNAGFNVLGVFSSCAATLEWLKTNSPDVAVLDIDLRDGDCVSIAKVLCARKIPFVVHSGSPASSGYHDPIFLKGKWVAKPCSPSDLADAVTASLALA
ncbi:response regulator [Mesorhizobium kowhaii]|uniref:Response regulatory domain-containing protein n=1 Tax=Mesorhizobium kowhaii TaxID=1300272 RepID=A0A2W7BT96_9HYPH|nr:response regulator [Mesorhizobium kowhaii]PZV33857.1 hypothetical protein B5V02_36965 [Mesorhizobium kowhaii]